MLLQAPFGFRSHTQNARDGCGKSQSAKPRCSFAKKPSRAYVSFVLSLLHRGFIFACLPHFYFCARGGFKARASRHRADICKTMVLYLRVVILEKPSLLLDTKFKTGRIPSTREVSFGMT